LKPTPRKREARHVRLPIEPGITT